MFTPNYLTRDLFIEVYSYDSGSELSHFEATVPYFVFSRDKLVKPSVNAQGCMDKLNGGNNSASSGQDLLISCMTFSTYMLKLYLCYRMSEGRITINFLLSPNSRVDYQDS